MAALRVDAVDVAGADLARRGVPFVIGVDAVARVGEPDAPVTLDHDVVRRVEASAVIALGQHRSRAVELGARNAAAAMLARDQATLPIDGIAGAVQRRLGDNRNGAVCLLPSQYAVVRNVRPHEVASGSEPRRSLGPAATGVELLGMHIRQRELAKARIDDAEGGGELEGHGMGIRWTIPKVGDHGRRSTTWR